MTCAELYEPATLIPPNLASITYLDCHRACSATPSPGTTQQFIVTGTFSDNSTEQLGVVTWISSDTTLAQISNDAGNHGLALAVVRAVAIAASAGTVTGSATLTRQ